MADPIKVSGTGVGLGSVGAGVGFGVSTGNGTGDGFGVAVVVTVGVGFGVGGRVVVITIGVTIGVGTVCSVVLVIDAFCTPCRETIVHTRHCIITRLTSCFGYGTVLLLVQSPVKLSGGRKLGLK